MRWRRHRNSGQLSVEESSAEEAPSSSTLWIVLLVGLVYYTGSFIIFRDVARATPSVIRGDSIIVGDELTPYFNPHSQLLEQAKGEFNQLTNGYEFRVRYSFLTTWLRHYQVLPFAILLVIPTIFWTAYVATARFIERVFTTLAPQSVYLATGFPTALAYLIMTYAKVTHFYTLVLGLAMMTIASLSMLLAVIFERTKWRRYMVLSSLVSLLNPAIHYLILFILFFALTIFTLMVGEIARWIRFGGPANARRLPNITKRILFRPGRRRKIRLIRRRLANSTMGRCVISGVIFVVVTLIPYALFVKFVALRGVPNLSETVPGDYYFIRDASVSWVHVLSWDLAGITDKILFGDYLAKVPRYPNIAYTLLMVVPLVVPPVRKRLFFSHQHRQLLGVLYVSIGFASWATIGYADPAWLPTFHRILAALTRTMYSTDSALGDLTLMISSTIVQVLRFPHRFQLILFMLAPLVMSISLAFGIDTLSGRWLARERLSRPTSIGVDRKTSGSETIMRLIATLWVGSVFFTPFWSNEPYRRVLSSGNFSDFLTAYPVADLQEVKQQLLVLPRGKVVVMPPTETAKLVTDTNGVDHKFIDKFFIYYLDLPSFYYGLTGDADNKFEFFLILRGLYYQEDWWINPARDIGVRYIVVNRKLRDNRGVGAEYLPNVESYIEPGLDRLPQYVARRFENESYILYEITDQPKEERETLLVDSSWPTYLDLVFNRLDLSRCYDFEYLPYYRPAQADDDPTVGGDRPAQTIHLLTDDPHDSAIDLYATSHPASFGRPDTKIFAFNPDIVASSYYLSPMFRMFLFFSNTKWNRTEVVTPGLFGTLRGGFIGVPRPTQFTVPVTIAEPGKYHLLMRAAVTANQLEISAPSVDLETSLEVRTSSDNMQLFDVEEVYQSDRVPVDTSEMSVEQLEQAIPERLVPVNRRYVYSDLGTIQATAGTHNFEIEKTDSNPMLFEGLVVIPEDEYAALGFEENIDVITDPSDLECSDRSNVRGVDDTSYVAPGANAEHETLSDEELLSLAAAGVETLVPDTSGGIGSNWGALIATGLLLFGSGQVVRWRSRPRVSEVAQHDMSPDTDTSANAPTRTTMTTTEANDDRNP